MKGEMQSLIDIANEYPIVHYEAPNGEIHACSLDAAHLWLVAGYFTSQMVFVIAPKGADVLSGDWTVWTLNELIERNGQPMPFQLYDEEKRRKEVESITVFSEELDDLRKRRRTLLGTMKSLQNRLDSAQTERLRIQDRIESAPTRVNTPIPSTKISPMNDRCVEVPECTTIWPNHAENVAERPNDDDPSLQLVQSEHALSDKNPLPIGSTTATVSAPARVSTQPIPLMSIPQMSDRVQVSLAARISTQPIPLKSIPPVNVHGQALTTPDRFIRIEQDRVYPVNGVIPFDVIHPIQAPVDQVEDTVTAQAKELTKLFHSRAPFRFRILTGHLFVEDQSCRLIKLNCLICEVRLTDGCDIMKHIIGSSHVEKMRMRKSTYAKESLAFWMYTLSVASKKLPTWPTQATLQSIPSIDIFVAPKPKVVEIKPQISAYEHQPGAMAVLRVKQYQVFPLKGIDPFNILCPFPAPVDQAESKVTEQAKELLNLFHGRNNSFEKLVQHLLEGKKLHCSVCKTKFEKNEAPEIILHLVGPAHVGKMNQGKLVYPPESLAFWMHALRIVPVQKNLQKKK